MIAIRAEPVHALKVDGVWSTSIGSVANLT